MSFPIFLAIKTGLADIKTALDTLADIKTSVDQITGVGGVDSLLVGTDVPVVGADIVTGPGGVVVSDGAGTAMRKITDNAVDFSFSALPIQFLNQGRFVSAFGFGATTTNAGNTTVYASITTNSSSIYPVSIRWYGSAYNALTNKQIFSVDILRVLGGATSVNFVSLGNSGATFLSAACFTVTDNGTVVTMNFYNNTAYAIALQAKIEAIYR